MNKATYTKMMAAGNAGEKITQKLYDELLAFAKAKKVKRPSAEWIAAGGAKAKCEPSLQGSDEECGKDARSNGLCAGHYSRLVYRADPAKAERVRESSRKYAAKQREVRAAIKAELAELAENETVAA